MSTNFLKGFSKNVCMLTPNWKGLTWPLMREEISKWLNNRTIELLISTLQLNLNSLCEWNKLDMPDFTYTKSRIRQKKKQKTKNMSGQQSQEMAALWGEGGQWRRKCVFSRVITFLRFIIFNEVCVCVCVSIWGVCTSMRVPSEGRKVSDPWSWSHKHLSATWLEC